MTLAPTKVVLHVGCGPRRPESLHPAFQTPEWRELRLDIDPAVQPDIIASLTDMSPVGSDSVDAIWSSHNLEHLYAHEVPMALREFYRVIKPGGVVLITLPDLQQVAAVVARGRLEETLLMAPAGPIAAIDVLYGYRPFLAEGNHFQAHKTGFVAQTLGQKLWDAGFRNVQVQPDPNCNLWAQAVKPTN
jgi:hypothetical protein